MSKKEDKENVSSENIVLEGKVEKTDRGGFSDEIIIISDNCDKNDLQGMQNILNILRSISDFSNIGLGMEIPNELSNYLVQHPIPNYNNYTKPQYGNFAPKTTYYRKNTGYSIPKKPQERIDYINKPNTTTNYVKFNNKPSQTEFTIGIKKTNSVNNTQNNQIREDILYPDINEQSQIKNMAKKYPLLDNTTQKSYSNTYQEKPTPLMGDKDYVPPKLYEQDLLKKENELLKKQLEYERKMKERPDILYPAIKNKQIECYTGGAADIKQNFNDVLVQFTDNYIDKHFANADKLKAMSKWVMPDAIENLDMAFEEHHLDTPFAREHTVFRSANELSPILREHVKKLIYEQLADDYGKNCVNTTKGIYFENDSKPSKNIAKSIAIKNYIQANKQYLKDFGYIKKSDTSFGLTEFNLWGAIGKAQIVEMYLEKSGEITFYLIDTYDFNKNESNFLVKAGRLNQERGRLIPYFSVYSVKIDKETASKYLK